MKRLISICSVIVTILAVSGAVQAGTDETYYNVMPDGSIVSPFGTYDSYGIWFDRDGVDPYQATSWGAVDGGTYNTGGIYNVVITYHAVSPTQATMFATINHIQRRFWTNHYATPS